MMRIITILFMVLAASYTFAGSDYRCVVTNAIEANIEGGLDEVGDKSIIGKEFTVDRVSGVVSVILKNNYLEPPTVIDQGSKDNSFKVLTVTKNSVTTSVRSLIIQEFIGGPKKPFVYQSNATVFYGVCSHF
jgi:hypothetical protein